MTLDQLVETLEGLIKDRGLFDQITLVRMELAGVPRAELTRKLEKRTRYVRITPVAELGGTWDFEMLGGSDGDPASDFDGRRGGDSEYTQWLVLSWLVQLTSWNDIPPFEKLQRGTIT